MMPSSADPAPRLRRWLPLLLLLLYVALLYGATALLQDGLFERDGYFHARFAEMMPRRWLSQSFPWTQLSTWRTQFCDKEFLYHLGMLPFARIGADPILGARIFSTLLAVAVLGTLHAVLRAQRVPFPAVFAFLPLATGGLFLARLGMIRSHVLSMLLLTLGVHLMLKKRYWALAALGFLYAWSYTVPFVLLMTAVPVAFGRWLQGEHLDLHLPFAAGAGSMLGLALHPYTPLTLETFLTYLQVFRLGLQGSAASGFELGNELYPYSWEVFLDLYPLLLILVAALLLALALWRRRLSAESWGLATATLFWFAMTLASPRFAEYSGLFLALACGLVARDRLPFYMEPGGWLEPPRRRLAAAAAVGLLLAGFHARSLTFFRVYQFEHAPPRYFTGACAWMGDHLAPGETVVNLFWDDFPELYYDGSRQTYLWGLDPTYSLRKDPEAALLLEHFRRRARTLDPNLLTVRFHARHLVLRASRAEDFPVLRYPPFREVYRDATAVVVAWD